MNRQETFLPIFRCAQNCSCKKVGPNLLKFCFKHCFCNMGVKLLSKRKIPRKT